MQVEVQKVLWELKLTDRQKVDEVAEHMERYGTDRSGPTADSSLTDVIKYMNGMQQQMTRKCLSGPGKESIAAHTRTAGARTSLVTRRS